MPAIKPQKFFAINVHVPALTQTLILWIEILMALKQGVRHFLDSVEISSEIGYRILHTKMKSLLDQFVLRLCLNQS